ncbi:hypothetical protein [Methylobacterium radiodurans]|nr:hypothetical protein [Methylobacterium radiodurans]
MLELMRLPVNGAKADELLAREFASEAAECQAAGDPGSAEIPRYLSRRHRIKSLELEARLTATRLDYTTLFDNGLDATR